MNLFCLNKFYDNEEIVVVVLGVFNVNVITFCGGALAFVCPESERELSVCRYMCVMMSLKVG